MQGYRYGGLVSKGGASMVAWMKANHKENPLYARFDRVVAILKKYDVVLSLGNGLRAGSIGDSFDRAMIQELLINCELAEEGRKMGCQMMVDLAMSKARRDLNWQEQYALALFPEDAMRIRADRSPTCDSSVCTMCGDFCANKASARLFQEALNGSAKA